jgi:hypothetical protein
MHLVNNTLNIAFRSAGRVVSKVVLTFGLGHSTGKSLDLLNWVI